MFRLCARSAQKLQLVERVLDESVLHFIRKVHFFLIGFHLFVSFLCCSLYLYVDHNPLSVLEQLCSI